MIKVGDKVRYVGPDTVAYGKGTVYTVTAYDDELEMFGVMSELGEDYYLDAECLEEIGNGRRD